MRKYFSSLIAGLLLTLPVYATELSLRADHPTEYVVVPGDTLWDISSRFLEDPWLWPKLWGYNPQVRNPHLIYPGDRIYLRYVDGEPRLSLSRGDMKLSPKVRVSDLGLAIPAVPLEAIRPFMASTKILDSEEQLKQSPYIIAGREGHLITGAGDAIYARGTFDDADSMFDILRLGLPLLDPETEELLGYRAMSVGRARLQSLEGDIGTLMVERSNQELRIGDWIYPIDEELLTATYYPKHPEATIDGVIIAVEGGVTQIGRHDIVIINRGTRDGLVEGDVLAIYQRGELVEDRYADELVKLPDVRGGLAMVVRTFDKVSYGLVVESNRVLRVGDKIVNP